MRQLLARTWGLVVVRGALAVLFGVVAVVWPRITVVALVILFGAYALVDGVVAVAMGVTGRGGERLLMLLLGVIGVVAGIVAFVWPAVTALALLFVIAFWAFLSGLTYLAAAWRLRKEITNEWLLALTGVASIVLAVVLLVQPATGAVALVFTIGVFAVVWGVLSIGLGIRMRSIAKEGGSIDVAHFE